ncbi:MAG: xanthine dehydrogenase family protein molybdopterin-binding subunit [Pseudomonadota bacterium]
MKRPDLLSSRRGFLKLSLVAGTGLVMGIRFPRDGRDGSSAPGPGSVHAGEMPANAWVRISSDNTVTVVVNHSEMGQGITTALPMIVAEELEADWNTVGFEIAPVADIYRHPHYGIQWTVSSRSVESSWQILREAGAAMREILIAAAASEWKVAADGCRARAGTVVHPASGRTLTYGELIRTAASMKMPAVVRLKEPHEFTIIGRSLPRLDGQAKIDGSARFGMDIRLPGMLSATVAHPPVHGAGIASCNSRDIEALPGVRRVVAVETGLAIVADTFWQAQVALDRLKVVWQPHERERIDSDHLLKRRVTLAGKGGRVLYSAGDIHPVMKTATRVLEAVYDLPYQAHATPEPMNCTADVREDSCGIWVPTQNQKGAQEIAAEVTGLPPESIRVHTTYLGGGFGRRALVDYVGEAVTLSMKMKAPVKVVWTREEDMRGDFYRPATHNLLKAVVDGQGRPLAWLHRIVGADAFAQSVPRVVTGMMPDVLPRMVKRTAKTLAERFMPGLIAGRKAILGAGPLPYAVDNIQVEYIDDDPGVPTCWWRSVAPSSNCFAVECFIDEIAVEAGRDPHELRRDLLADSPRLRHVVDLAAEKANWHGKAPAGIHRGLACHNFQETMMAMVAEVSVEPGKRVRVHRVVCAVDCGTAVNPRIIEAQVQSGIVFGLTAALKSEITIRAGSARESNFHDFPLLRFDEMPTVITHIVVSSRPPTGMGEVAVPVIGPAVANAVSAATGRRVRRLPIRPEELG